MPLNENQKKNLHSIAYDWMCENEFVLKYRAVKDCIKKYPDVNWTTEARAFLKKELEWIER